MTEELVHKINIIYDYIRIVFREAGRYYRVFMTVFVWLSETFVNQWGK